MKATQVVVSCIKYAQMNYKVLPFITLIIFIILSCQKPKVTIDNHLNLFMVLTGFKCYGPVSSSPNPQDVIVEVKLMGRQNHHGEWSYTEIGKIDEYDENGSMNPMPDTINVSLKLDLAAYDMQHDFLKGDLVVKDFDIDVSVRFMVSESKNCINMRNPQILEHGVLLSNKKISYDDFFKLNKYHSIYVATPLLMKKALASIEKNKLFLNQIIVTAKIKVLNDKKDVIEYYKPICN